MYCDIIIIHRKGVSESMKKWVFLFLFLFFGFIFSLKLQSDSVPNIFLIEAVVIVVAYFLQIVARIITVFNIKKKAEEIYGCDFKYNSMIKLVFSVFPKHISLHNKDNTMNLIIIFVRKKHAKYHFASKNSVEVYRGNRENYRTGKVRYSIGKNVTWNLVGKIKISCDENRETVFILTKSPIDITSSDKTANEYLTNGDVFLNDCTVLSKKHFMGKSKKLREYIKNNSKLTLEYFDLYNLKIDGVLVNLYVSHKRATKATHIHCTDGGDVVWEQFYLFGGMSRLAREKKYLLKPICDKTAATVVVIRGKPGNITGLDDGLFKSHLNFAKNDSIYLMTEQNLPLFLSQLN